ncbi:MAG TPA: hypothetical protein VGM83_06455 [Devosiaceae bacterium]|jgi:hypothetical protein
MELFTVITQNPLLTPIIVMFVALSTAIAWGQLQTRGLNMPAK